MRTYTVYKGTHSGRLIYIGTTIQVPSERFRWHKYNGKDLVFTVLSQHDNADDMLDEEWRLIQLHKPKLNKNITHRQNLNAKLTPEVLEGRLRDGTWCKNCLRRRVNKGYTKCAWC